MSITQANGVCPAILTGINEVLKESNPQSLVTPVGGLQSLLDPTNTKPVTMEQLGQGGQGHRKAVRIWHKQRQLVSDVSDTHDCDAGTEKTRFEDVFEVNQFKEITIEKSEASVRELCDAYSQMQRLGATGSAGQLGIMRDFAEDLIMDLDPLRQAINDAIHTSIALNIGLFVGGAATKTIDVIQSATDHSVNNAGFNIMRQELLKTGYPGMPIVFGNGNLDFALMSLGYGCCNDGGSDFEKMMNQVRFKFYRDYSVLSDYYSNANSAIAFMPGTLQFVPYNQYVGSFASPIGTKSRGTIPDPVLPGVSYDISVQPSECAESYTMKVGLYFDLYAAPTTLFATGDRLEGVNGVFEFVADTVS